MGLETFIVAGSLWLFGKYHSKFVDGFLDFLKESGLSTSNLAKWVKYGWTFAPAKYDDRVRELHGKINLLGRSNSVSLEGIFTDVYVLNELTAFRRFDITELEELEGLEELEELEELHNSLGSEASRLDGLELVKNPENKRLFILGRPGAGKTTFLKYLVLQATNGEINQIPIFVSLKEWDDSGLELFPFIVKQFEICDFPDAGLFVKYILKHGHAMVLFDGLDEVKQEAGKREKMIAELRDFSHQYWDSQCLITCRIAATDYSFVHFQYVELADFKDEQIDEYVSKWFSDEPKKLEIFREEFNKSENRGLRQLARQPILLALICIYFDQMLVFAHRQVEVYEKALEALLIKWDSSRLIRRDEIYQGLSVGRKMEMFARIAARTFQDNEYFLDQDKLVNYIVEYLRQLPNAETGIDFDGVAVLKAIEEQHGIFSERADRIYSFSHLTFQEYFTAKYIVSDSSGRALRSLLSKNIITNDRWNEVIRFTASLLGNADMFFEKFQEALDDCIKDKPELIKILKWAQIKANSVQVKEQVSIVSAIYCLLGLTADRALHNNNILLNFPDSYKNHDYIQDDKWASTLESIRRFMRNVSKWDDHPLPRALNSIHNRIFEIDSYMYSNEIEANNFSSLRTAMMPMFIYLNAFIQAPVLSYDYVLDITLLQLLEFALLFKRLSSNPELNVIAPQFQLLILRTEELSLSGGQTQLAEELRESALLLNRQGEERWYELEKGLLEAMQKNRNLAHYWGFDVNHYNKIEIYFKSCTLFNDSLRQAVVSDRKTIENKLLLLPSLPQ